VDVVVKRSNPEADELLARILRQNEYSEGGWDDMAIYESGENYLETIFILQEKNGTVRSIDVANELGYTKASVSRAMSILKKAEYIKIAESGNILLTESGRQKATQIFNRHKIITEFLMNTLQVDEALADKDACRIEHIISEEVFEKMKKYVENGETL